MTDRPRTPSLPARCAVLGATGKLGRLLRHHWTRADDCPQVTWIARRPAPGMLCWAPGDDAAALPPVDTLICLWGVTSGTPGALAANAALARAAMELGREIGAQRVLHCSSAAVYPGGETAWREEDVPAPRAPYGAAKVAMEGAVARWSADHPDGPAACCLRLANVAGADQLFAAMARGDTVTLDRFADNRGPRRSYVAPSDLARALATLATLSAGDLPAVLNLSGPEPVAMEALLRAAGASFRWQEAPPQALDEMRLSDRRLAGIVGPLSRSADPAALVAEGRALETMAT